MVSWVVGLQFLFLPLAALKPTVVGFLKNACSEAFLTVGAGEQIDGRPEATLHRAEGRGGVHHSSAKGRRAGGRGAAVMLVLMLPYVPAEAPESGGEAFPPRQVLPTRVSVRVSHSCPHLGTSVAHLGLAQMAVVVRDEGRVGQQEHSRADSRALRGTLLIGTNNCLLPWAPRT